MQDFKPSYFYLFYQIYRFKWLVSNRFYPPSINWLPLTVHNNTDHLLVSAGVWFADRQIWANRISKLVCRSQIKFWFLFPKLSWINSEIDWLDLTLNQILIKSNGIYRRFLILSHVSLSLVIPNNKTVQHWRWKCCFIAML